MIGYRISVQFNASYAFRDRPAVRDDTSWYELHQTISTDFLGASKSGVRRCERCGQIVFKWDHRLNGLVVKKRRYDISATYDGIDIVSARFKTTYETHVLTGLHFIQLPDDPAFFQILATDVVCFDAERRGTRFEKQCDVCGQYDSIIGATPVYLKEGSVVPDRGFARTDIEFATRDEKHHILLCGPKAAEILKAEKLRGLELVAF